MESHQKNEALKKADALSENLRELELQLKSEAQKSHEALENIQRAEELGIQLQSEATEKAELLELRVAELERQLNEQSRAQDEAEKQVKVVPWSWAQRLSSDSLSTDIQTLFYR